MNHIQAVWVKLTVKAVSMGLYFLRGISFRLTRFRIKFVMVLHA
jgi:hypothetical protein